MTSDQFILAIRALLAEYDAPPVPVPDPEPQVVVAAPDTLQGILDAGVPRVALIAGERYPGFTVRRPVTLLGNGAHVHGEDRAAIYVAPTTADVFASQLVCTSTWREAVVLLGDNLAETQGSVELVPRRIRLSQVQIPSHRGKAGFAVHARECELIDCTAHDVYDPDGADSKGIWIHNTPGPVTVLRGHYEAGSENVMVGGDTAKIPGNIPSDLVFDSVTLHKPESWRSDGINRRVKNLLELKAGRRVVVRNCTMSGSWVASQTGYAIVITPKNGHVIEDVLFDNVTVDRCASGVQMMGLDYNSVTPQATRGIVFRNSRFTISKAQYGGTKGHLALYVGGMLDSTWDNVRATFDGQMIVECDSQTQTGPFTMRGCRMPTGTYGIKAPGANYGNLGYAGRELAAVLEGNTFADAHATFRANFAGNTYCTRAELEAMP